MGDAPSTMSHSVAIDDQRRPGLSPPTQGPVSPLPGSSVSLKGDQSMGETLVVNSQDIQASSDPSEQGSDLTQDQSRCGVCEQVLRDPVIATCGQHSVCEDCIGRHSDQAAPSEEDHACPLCSEELRDIVLQSVIQAYKDRLKKRFEYVSDGGVQTLLHGIYAELRHAEGESEGEGVEKEHEVWWVGPASGIHETSGNDTSSCCNNDIFRPLAGGGEGGYIKTVLTKGVAGVGKTVSVQKFILDWADGRANQDVDFVFVFPFRRLSLIGRHSSRYSLRQLLLEFHPELKELNDDAQQLYEVCKLVLIFDGLDESQLALNFHHGHGDGYVLCDTNNSVASVDVLVTNLIQGNLLPSAQVWVTSRPAATNRIPAKYVDRVTEIRGFGDTQREEYFRKRTGGDEVTARRINSHIKSSRSLRTMCQIPAVCSIATTVFEYMRGYQGDGDKLPQTLTEMFVHFLLRQVHMENEMLDGEEGMDREALLKLKADVIVKLAELAFTQLARGNLRFHEDDLGECGIGVGTATVYSVVFREIFREESPIEHHAKVFSFVHPSVQEFLAAFFVIRCSVNRNVEPLEIFLRDTTASTRDRGLGGEERSGENRKGVLSSIKHIFEPVQPMEAQRFAARPAADESAVASLALLKSVVDSVVESSDGGRLDRFLRFLVGLSLESNQELLLLGMLLPETSPDDVSKVAQYVRALLLDNTDIIAAERCVSLRHCLMEVPDDCVHRDVQRYLRSRRKPEETSYLSPAHCSALAHLLLVSEEVLEELDLRRYNTSDKGRRRLLPALRCCRKALVGGCELDERSIETVVSALRSLSCPLRELDLSNNDLHDSWIMTLSSQLKSNHCRLETLRLSSCALKDTGCAFLSSVLSCPASCLRELDLSNNHLQDAGAMLLSAQLDSPLCKLEILRIASCGFTDAGCKYLASAVRCHQSPLGELDLRGNHIRKPTAQTLLDTLLDPRCKLHVLRLDHAAVLWIYLGPVQHACALTLDPNTAHSHLSLSGDCRQATHSPQEEQAQHPAAPHPERFQHRPQVLCRQPLSGRCYWEAEWSHDGVSVGVSYRGIGRKGWSRDRLLGYNDQSWCLFYSHGRYSAWHNKNQTAVVPRRSRSWAASGTEPTHNQVQSATRAPTTTDSSTVGVYLDWPAGTLSFYSVSSDTLTRLHAFEEAAFSEPLYPAFRLRDLNSSLTLHEISS